LKKYDYNPDFYNRELITTYGVLIKKDSKLQKCERVKDLIWLSWDKFRNLLWTNPRDFTKTARIFCSSNTLNGKIEELFKALIDKDAFVCFKDKIYYLSYEDYDMIFESNDDSSWSARIFNTLHSMKFIAKYKKIKFVEHDIWNKLNINQESFKFLHKEFDDLK